MSEPSHDARLMELETKLAYQEATLETLNQELIRQQQLVEQLQRAVRTLAERLPAPTPEGAARGSLEDEIPPHY
ncbi:MULTISPECIES: SlyX family protein [Hydrocarboniphaga]|nr:MULTISPECIES: SlyX family protein [Hydrocarboniphaga]MDZ4079663.1 SlyX family protein [Hydrocarboniphaga sp.]